MTYFHWPTLVDLSKIYFCDLTEISQHCSSFSLPTFLRIRYADRKLSNIFWQKLKRKCCRTIFSCKGMKDLYILYLFISIIYIYNNNNYIYYIYIIYIIFITYMYMLYIYTTYLNKDIFHLSRWCKILYNIKLTSPR